MKKLGVLFLGVILMCSLVLAAQGNGQGSEVTSAAATQVRERVQEMSELGMGEGQKVRSQLTISNEGNENRTQVKLSNGRNAEVKIMPETASETALQRLRLKNCSESDNCTMELKEVGEGNQSRAAYEVRAQKTFKFLGLFGSRQDILTQIDAENGEVIRTQRPWWSFLASESEEN